jgi:hypothetical protein
VSTMRILKKLASRFRQCLFTFVLQKSNNSNTSMEQSINQKILWSSFAHLYHSKMPPFSFKHVGFRVFSQNDEDGILLYIFSLIGATNRKCVEICAGDGIECNTANLIINHRWIGLLCDGNKKNVRKAKQFYSNHPDTRFWPPAIVLEWITKDNVNQIIQENGFYNDIDLLSLDIDGIDYWLWKEISCISPRVVVLEFNHLLGPEISVSVPYRDDFVAEFTQFGSDYAGASLKAFVKLGKEKGYRLVGTNMICTNAFFVREDIRCDWLPEIKDISNCFDHPRAIFGMTHRFPGIKEREWVEV